MYRQCGNKWYDCVAGDGPGSICTQYQRINILNTNHAETIDQTSILKFIICIYILGRNASFCSTFMIINTGPNGVPLYVHVTVWILPHMEPSSCDSKLNTDPFSISLNCFLPVFCCFRDQLHKRLPAITAIYNSWQKLAHTAPFSVEPFKRSLFPGALYNTHALCTNVPRVLVKKHNYSPRLLSLLVREQVQK